MAIIKGFLLLPPRQVAPEEHTFWQMLRFSLRVKSADMSSPIGSLKVQQVLYASVMAPHYAANMPQTQELAINPGFQNNKKFNDDRSPFKLQHSTKHVALCNGQSLRIVAVVPGGAQAIKYVSADPWSPELDPGFHTGCAFQNMLLLALARPSKFYPLFISSAPDHPQKRSHSPTPSAPALSRPHIPLQTNL